jgi:AcrR family transcriptional regulator
VIGAAGRILQDRRPDETTTHEIADRAGVSVGSLYQYFPTKEAVFGALIDYRLEQDLRAIDEWLGAHDGPLHEVMGSFVRRAVELHRTMRPLYRVMLPLVGPMRRQARVRHAMAKARAKVRAKLESRPQELRKTDLELPIFLMGHAVEAALRAVVDERPELLDDPRLEAELADMIARYMLRDD